MPRSSRKPPTRTSKSKRVAKKPSDPSGTRHEQVLDTALALIADHGIAGASLRRLASELGMSQPSLYHYFPSKHDLVVQIVERCVDRMRDVALVPDFPKAKAELPRFIRDAVLALYRNEHHPQFVRFLFVVALESRENRELIKKVFEERLAPSFDTLAALFTSDSQERGDLSQLCKMIVYAIGFRLLEERALFRAPAPSAELMDYADWVTAAAERLVSMGPRVSKKTNPTKKNRT